MFNYLKILIKIIIHYINEYLNYCFNSENQINKKFSCLIERG